MLLVEKRHRTHCEVIHSIKIYCDLLLLWWRAFKAASRPCAWAEEKWAERGCRDMASSIIMAWLWWDIHLQMILSFCDGFKAQREVISVLPRTANVCALVLIQQIPSITWGKSGSSDVWGSWELASRSLQGGDESSYKWDNYLLGRFCQVGNTLFLRSICLPTAGCSQGSFLYALRGILWSWLCFWGWAECWWIWSQGCSFRCAVLQFL